MLSDLWERIRSTVAEGVGWVGDTWAIRTLSGAGRAAVAPIVDLLGEPFAEFVTRLGDAVDAIVRLVLTPIRRAWTALAPQLANLAVQARVLASSTYGGLRNVMRVHLPRLRQWAAQRIGDVIRSVAGLRRWVIDRVLRPLGERITGMTRWATQRISDLWRRGTELRQWVIDRVLVPLAERITGLVRFVYGRVLAAVHLVEEVWATLQMIARYGPGQLFLLLLPGGMGRLATSLMRSTQGSALEAVEALDDAADRMLRL